MTTDTRSADEIERDIELRRRELSSNLNDLQQKLSIDGLVQQVTDKFRTHGGDIGQAIYDQVRTNPVPLALTGIGLAWMMFAGSTPPRQGPRLPPHSDGWSNPAAPETRAAPAPTPNPAYRPRPSYDYSRSPTWARPTTNGASGPSMTDTLSQKAGQVKDAAAETLSNTADAAQSAVDRAKTGIGAATDAAASRASQAGAALSETALSMQDSISRFGQQIAEGTEQLSEEARARVIAARRKAIEATQSLPSMADTRDFAADSYDRQPLVFGALALAVGAALGSAMPRTRTEDAYLGQTSDDLFSEAERIFSEERGKLERVASKTLDEVKAVVSDNKAELDAKAPGDKTAAEAVREKIEESVDRVAGAAKDASREEKLGTPAL